MWADRDRETAAVPVAGDTRHDPAEAVLMAMAERDVFDELTGDGVDRLRR